LTTYFTNAIFIV